MKTNPVCLVMVVALGAMVLTCPPAWAESPDYGDDYTLANPLTVGTTTYGVLDTSSDVDWLIFGTAGSTLYQVTATNQDSNWKGFSIYQQDEFGEPVLTYNFSLYADSQARTFFLDAAYPAYVVISGSAGDYAVTVNTLGSFLPDGYGDTCAAADQLLVDAAPTVGTIAPENQPDVDNDWFYFDTQPLHMYQVDITHADNSYVRFRTYAANCLDYLHSDTHTITLTSWYGESYHLLAVGDTNRLGNYYEIQIQDIGTYTDEHGNTYDAATTVPTNGTATYGVINYNSTLNSDLDWLHFACPGNARYAIALVNPDSNWKTVTLYQLDEFDVVRQVTNWSCYNNTETRYVFLDAARPCYLEIDGAGGNYHVTVTQVEIRPSDSHADDCASATAMTTDGTTVTATIAPDGDLDWFRFTTQTLHMYRVSVQNDFNSWVGIETHAGDCSGRIHTNITNNSITIVSWYDEPYSLRATGDAARFGNRYELTVEDLGLQPDDFGNDRNAAAAIDHDGTWVNGAIEYGATIHSDEDWFVFTAPAAGSYDLGFHNLATNWKEITLFKLDSHNDLVQVQAFSLYNNQEIRSYTLDPGLHYIRVRYASGNYRVSMLSPIPRCGDLEHPYPPGDVNRDCYVDMLDVQDLAIGWLSCTDPNPPCSYQQP